MKIQEYVDRCARRLRLGFWRIDVSWERQEDCFAVIETEDHRWDATLKIDPVDWLKADDQFRREIIAHELAHLLVKPLAKPTNETDPAEEQVAWLLARSWCSLLPSTVDVEVE